MAKTSEARIARGCYQRSILNSLVSGYEVSTPQRHIRGRAKQYLGRYNDSFWALLERMEAAGYKLQWTYGPRGGMWGATVRIAQQ